MFLSIPSTGGRMRKESHRPPGVNTSSSMTTDRFRGWISSEDPVRGVGPALGRPAMALHQDRRGRWRRGRCDGWARQQAVHRDCALGKFLCDTEGYQAHPDLAMVAQAPARPVLVEVTGPGQGRHLRRPRLLHIHGAHPRVTNAVSPLPGENALASIATGPNERPPRRQSTLVRRAEFDVGTTTEYQLRQATGPMRRTRSMISS